MAESSTEAPKRKGKNAGRDANQQKVITAIAKTLSGVKGPEWKGLDKEKKRPHMQMARKVLAIKERFDSGANAAQKAK
jgi:hypothetical protein